MQKEKYMAVIAPEFEVKLGRTIYRCISIGASD